MTSRIKNRNTLLFLKKYIKPGGIMDRLKLIDEYFQFIGQGYEIKLKPMGYYYFYSKQCNASSNNLVGLLEEVIKKLKIY